MLYFIGYESLDLSNIERHEEYVANLILARHSYYRQLSRFPLRTY